MLRTHRDDNMREQRNGWSTWLGWSYQQQWKLVAFIAWQLMKRCFWSCAKHDPKNVFKNRLCRRLGVWLKHVLCNVVCLWSGKATVKVLEGISTHSWPHTKWVEHGGAPASDCSHITRVLYVVWMCVCVAQTFSFTEKQLYNMRLFNTPTFFQRDVQIMVYGIQSLGEV